MLPGRDHLTIHITGQREAEVLEEDGIVEMPTVGDGIDDGVGGGVGFEEAGSAIDADGFGGGGFGEAYPAAARGDADALDVGDFED